MTYVAIDIEQGQLRALKEVITTRIARNASFREMLKLWLKQVAPPPTWSAIIEVIEIFEYKSLAEELRKNYCTVTKNVPHV